MSEYNEHIFLGFAACAPKLIPGWLYSKIFCPPVEEDANGQVKYAHCGQRKIEAALLNNGFDEKDIAVVRPDRISKVIDEGTKVLCITTHDPLGLGPASTTFSDLVKKEPFTSFYFRQLMQNPIIKKNNLKVVVGGSGAWQLTDERIMANLGIDCVVVGEGELTAVNIVEKALNGEQLPSFVEGEVVPLDQIPLIKKPTLNGIIEIVRGCGRGCRFCNPTMLNFRCQSIDNIIKEAKVNVDAGKGVLFHAEDVLRYNTKGFVPNEYAVLTLFTEIKKLTERIALSHFAHASVAAKPGLIEKLSELMDVGSKQYPFMSGQVGIETGSSRIVAKYMKGKAKPFKPEEWPEMIIQSHKILNDNNWVPVETVIVGLPDEKPEDVQKTIDLIHDVTHYRSLIIPLFFVPLGNLHGKSFFKSKYAIAEHWQLLAVCINHSLKWSYELAGEDLSVVGVGRGKIWAIKRVIKILHRKLKPYLLVMEEGINPMTFKAT